MSCNIAALPQVDLAPVEQLRTFRRVPMDCGVRFNQVVVTGPPGCGKSTFVRDVGGWPEEGYLDLSMKRWWLATLLATRPREVHFGLPFSGQPRGLALFDPVWLERWRDLTLESGRIQLPPLKRNFLSVNWRGRFVFEFLLPPAEHLLERRRERAQQGTHPIDARIDLDRIRAQLTLCGRIALHFHDHGMQVRVREQVLDEPLRILSPPTELAS